MSPLEKTRKNQMGASLALVLVSVIWGSGFIAVDLVQSVAWTTNQIMAARFGVAALVMLLALRDKLKLSSKREIFGGVVAGILLYLSFYLQTLGQGLTTVSNTAFFTATNVVMVPFLSWPILKKRPRLKTILFTMLSLAGVAVLSYTGGSFSLNAGDFLILLCALTFAMHITFLEKAGRGTDAGIINFYQIATAAVISAVVFLFDRQSLEAFQFSAGVLPVIYLGIVSTCLCYFLQTKAQQYLPAAVAGVILSLEGLFGSSFSVLLGLENLTASLVIGGILVILATVLMNWDQSRSFSEEDGGSDAL